jgi:hypothetical protein
VWLCMMIQAAYLCGQADVLGLPVIDTTALDIEQAADALVAHVLGQ